MVTKIVLYPEEGLCNRMRAIATACYIAEKNDCKIKIVWAKRKNCHVNLSSLFEVNCPNVSIVEGFPSKLIGLKLKILRKLLGDKLVLTSSTIVSLKAKGTIEDYFKQKKGTVSIMTYESLFDLDFMRNKKVFQKYIIPKREILCRIDKKISNGGGRYIGIHIRRTDNTLSKEKSKLVDFIQIMRKEIAEDDSVKFFIASDSEEVKKELLEHFGENRIFCYDSLLQRDSEKGMEFAMLELCTLSKCEKIYGSYWSSYSEVASLMGDIPLTVVLSTP